MSTEPNTTAEVAKRNRRKVQQGRVISDAAEKSSTAALPSDEISPAAIAIAIRAHSAVARHKWFIALALFTGR